MQDHEHLDEVDAEWERILFGRSSTVAICRAETIGCTVLTASAPISYENLIVLLDTKIMARLPLREIDGRQVHIYVPASMTEEEGQRELKPFNADATEFCLRWGLHEQVYGDAVFLTGDAIHPRDLHASLVTLNSATIPEIERDYALSKQASVDKEWDTIERVCKDRHIPPLLSAVPSASRICWLLKIAFTGLEKDVETYAAVQEAAAKYPLLHQALVALGGIQSYYFAGKFDELAPDEESGGPWGPVLEPEPIGYNKNYGSVVH